MCFLPSEAIVDLVGYAGFDFVMFDQEHASYDIGCIERLVRASEAAGIPSLVRMPNPDPYQIARVLDTGADGLLFARMQSAAQAAEIVSLCRLAPIGERGACPGSRAARYFLRERSEYARRANETAIVVVIETKEALAEIEDIVAVPGIDVVGMGPSDLSFSLGVERDDPMIAEAEERIMKAAKDAGVGFIKLVKTAEDTGPWLEDPHGPRIFWYTTDAFQIGQSFHSLIKDTHKILEQNGGKRLATVGGRD
jgi:4-hydroxy-2-oxoheptanedioate aldolase